MKPLMIILFLYSCWLVFMQWQVKSLKDDFAEMIHLQKAYVEEARRK